MAIISKAQFYSAFCVILISTIGYYLYNVYSHKAHKQPFFNSSPDSPVVEGSSKLFTKKELANYDGRPGSQGIYIAILGLVFDVESGRKHYEPGSSYAIFAGRDASTSFITGQFEGVDLDDLDDALQLKSSDAYSLIKWVDFYTKNYILVGKVIGRFYDENGEKTEYCHLFQEHANKSNDPKELESKLAESRKYPACNIEWKPDTGTRVWCTKNSGGIKRDWVGYPRQYSTSTSSEPRCICAQKQHLDQTVLKEYAGCDSTNSSCIVPNTKKSDLDAKDRMVVEEKAMTE